MNSLSSVKLDAHIVSLYLRNVKYYLHIVENNIPILHHFDSLKTNPSTFRHPSLFALHSSLFIHHSSFPNPPVQSPLHTLPLKLHTLAVEIAHPSAVKFRHSSFPHSFLRLKKTKTKNETALSIQPSALSPQRSALNPQPSSFSIPPLPIHHSPFIIHHSAILNLQSTIKKSAL